MSKIDGSYEILIVVKQFQTKKDVLFSISTPSWRSGVSVFKHRFEGEIIESKEANGYYNQDEVDPPSIKNP